MKKLRVGIVGAGNIAQSAHLPAYKKFSDRVEVAAIADTNLARAKEAAKTFGIPKAFSSVEELLASSDVDFIDICVWNYNHAPAAIAAARAGKAILCEKPMADSLAHSLEMESEVKKAGVPFMMAMPSRFSAESMLIHEMAETGELGDIYYAKTGCVRRRGTPIGWFTDVSKSGGGPVIDIGVHVIDVTWFLMGRPKPTRVSSAISYAIGNFKTKGVDRWTAFDPGDGVFDTEDSASAIIHFENGASMLVETSWALNAAESRYTQICGSKGGAILDPFTIFTENSLGYLADLHPIVPKVNEFEEEISHFIDCLITGKKPIAPIEDGIAVQRMLAGIYDSAKLGKEVNL
jgi:predicted dehydrogenase